MTSRAMLKGGAQVAAELAVRRTGAARACACGHVRADHVNSGKCLDQWCGCRKFALPEPEPDDIGT